MLSSLENSPVWKPPAVITPSRNTHSWAVASLTSVSISSDSALRRRSRSSTISRCRVSSLRPSISPV